MCVNDEAVDDCPYDPNHGYVQTTQRIFACQYNSAYNEGTSGSPCVEHASSEGNPTMQGFVKNFLDYQIFFLKCKFFYNEI